MKFRLALAFCLLAASPALAQPQTARSASAPAPEVKDAFQKELNALFVPDGMTAEKAASRAARVSPEVMRRVAELDAAIATYQAAQLSRVPYLTGNASYTRLSPIDALNFGGGFAIAFPENSYAFQGQVAVPLSDYALRFPPLIEAARLGTQAARTNKTASEVNAAQDARIAYYEWLRVKLQALVAKHQHQQTQTVLKQVRALAEAQRLSKADLMRVESNDADAEREENQLNYLAQLREEQLRLLIGASPEEPLVPSEAERGEVSAPKAQTLDDLVRRAVAQRLEFRALDLGIRAKEKQRQAELANLLPRLSAFATADYANPNQRVFPLKEQFDFTWQAGVQLSWTLNDALISRTTDRRLRAEANQLRADRESLLRGTRIELLAAQQGVATAQLSVATTAKGLAAAEESYRVRRELLNAERATVVELVDAETDLTRARFAAINARINLRVALAQLAHALGEDVPTRR
jgi:outer membrane protein TolC